MLGHWLQQGLPWQGRCTANRACHGTLQGSQRSSAGSQWQRRSRPALQRCWVLRPRRWWLHMTSWPCSPPPSAFFSRYPCLRSTRRSFMNAWVAPDQSTHVQLAGRCGCSDGSPCTHACMRAGLHKPAGGHCHAGPRPAPAIPASPGALAGGCQARRPLRGLLRGRPAGRGVAPQLFRQCHGCPPLMGCHDPESVSRRRMPAGQGSGAAHDGTCS